MLTIEPRVVIMFWARSPIYSLWQVVSQSSSFSKQFLYKTPRLTQKNPVTFATNIPYPLRHPSVNQAHAYVTIVYHVNHNLQFQARF